MRNWSISVGKIFGIELRIHLTFFILPLFIWWTEYASHGKADSGRDFALLGIIFACVILHELGHAVVAMRAGVHPVADWWGHDAGRLAPLGGEFHRECELAA